MAAATDLSLNELKMDPTGFVEVMNVSTESIDLSHATLRLSAHARRSLADP